ncbi:hypothetical protein Scep_024487 [Stephania cephalantha]|uniref:Pectinesterase n=1 Tax=Stephania cephalantha TaxID=152367 RepID=A0AAP0F252_9MAGN
MTNMALIERAALLVTIIVLVIVQLVPTIDVALNSTLVTVEKSVKAIKVRKDGSGDFKTIREGSRQQRAFRELNTKRTIIYIGPGEYKEKNFAQKPDGWSLNEKQAVAMRISGDKVAFYNCKFLGYKDTLYDYKGNHFFQNCYIEGTVDFIFGDGRSLYLRSELHSVAEGEFAITAPGMKQAGDDSGFAFVHYCKISGIGNTYLSWVWKKRAKAVFAYTCMGSLIKPGGWSDKVFLANFACQN